MTMEWVRRQDGRWSADIDLRINGKITVASIHRPIGSSGETHRIVLTIKLPGIKMPSGMDSFLESEIEECKAAGIAAVEHWFKLVN